ncbi:MAG: hypothetical protein IJN19_04405 [Opitutales bacterium]|nr:hypothetical protein [Opitutales bacterium]
MTFFRKSFYLPRLQAVSGLQKAGHMQEFSMICKKVFYVFSRFSDTRRSGAEM